MKSTTKRLLTLFIRIYYLLCTIEATTIPRSYIVEYVQQEGIQSSNNHHDTINKDLSQYKDLYNIHETYSSPIFYGMSISLKNPSSQSQQSQPQQRQSITPSAYSTTISSSSADMDHPVYHHLQSHPAIKKIYLNHEVPRPQWMPNTRNYSYSFPYANKDSQINDVHQKLGITGSDILIGVLDSGVYY